MKEYLKNQIAKLESDFSENDSSNDESRIILKQNTNNLLLNKYNELERKFEGFQNELKPHKPNVKENISGNSSNLPKNNQNTLYNKSPVISKFPNKKVLYFLFKRINNYKSTDQNGKGYLENKTEVIDNKLKDLMKSSVVYSKSSLDGFNNNILSKQNNK